MSIEEAIEQFQNAIDLIKQNGKDWLDERDIPMLNMAIKALKQTDGDLISRKAVIDVIEREQFKGDAISEIEKLPSADKEQKMGQWIYTGDYITDGMLKCSECGFEYDVSERFSYCPNCGADMRKESEE